MSGLGTVYERSRNGQERFLWDGQERSWNGTQTVLERSMNGLGTVYERSGTVYERSGTVYERSGTVYERFKWSTNGLNGI